MGPETAADAGNGNDCTHGGYEKDAKHIKIARNAQVYSLVTVCAVREWRMESGE